MNHKKANNDDIATFSVPDPNRIIQISKMGSLSDISFETIKEIGQLWKSPIVKIIDNITLIKSLLYKLKIMTLDDPQKDNIRKMISAFDSDLWHSRAVSKYGLVILNTDLPEWYLNWYSFYTIDPTLLKVIKATLSFKSENKKPTCQKNKLKFSHDLDDQLESLVEIEPEKQDFHSVCFEFSGEIAPEIDKSTVCFAKL